MQAVLESKRQSAIADLLGQRAEIDQHLSALGYDGTSPAPKPTALSLTTTPKAAKPGKKTAAERYCSYCNEFGHDGRAHRFQKKKKRFTQAERDAINA